MSFSQIWNWTKQFFECHTSNISAYGCIQSCAKGSRWPKSIKTHFLCLPVPLFWQTSHIKSYCPVSEREIPRPVSLTGQNCFQRKYSGQWNSSLERLSINRWLLRLTTTLRVTRPHELRIKTVKGISSTVLECKTSNNTAILVNYEPS